VRPFSKVLVWGRNAENAAACARDIAADLSIEAVAVTDPAEVVRKSQLVVTTTPAREPVLKADWLHPGLHITAMGADQSGKNEIDPAAILAADLFVCDRVSQSETVGELQTARKAGFPSDRVPPELGEIIAGSKTGRGTDDQVTICDLTGTGAQDTAIATYALLAAKKAGIGTIIKA
jgi:ornithine cyclodeaminase